ncbi:MAG TPA: PIG-L family deacetylase [Steroidobacteraceae bacterium]|nr:PIG-L family deacetylase [Steroidobacteraceae bacterium]
MRNPSPSRRRRILATLIAGLALAIALLLAEAWRRHALYWYDVRRDQAYDFPASSHRALPVEIGATETILPAWDGPWDTALLRLRISARLAGWWFEPCIVINSGARADRQCFERGAQGDRYLLLRPGTAVPGQRLELRGQHLDWQPQAAELLLFDNQDLGQGRVLVLSPHPDDAEIAAFGLYSSRESFIVTMTAGNYVDGRYAEVHDDPSVQDALRGEVRSWDSLVVPQWGGVPPERVVNLGYETHSLPRFFAAAQGAADAGERDTASASYRQGAIEALLGGRTATADWASVVADLVAVLSTVRPGLIVTPHPALDAAPDHQFTTVALLEALSVVDDDRATLLLYDNHHRLAEYYPFGPSDTWIGPPPWFGGLPFGGVYSVTLDESAQLRKLFALEAMHDLRAPPRRLTGGPAGIFAGRLREAFRLVRRDPVGDYSYFRRAVRPNELFFVYRPGERDTLGNPPP